MSAASFSVKCMAMRSYSKSESRQCLCNNILKATHRYNLYVDCVYNCCNIRIFVRQSLCFNL